MDKTLIQKIVDNRPYIQISFIGCLLQILKLGLKFQI